MSIFPKRTLFTVLNDAFVRALEQGRENTALCALAAIGQTQGVEALHELLMATASVTLAEQMRHLGLAPGSHEWAVAPPAGSDYTIDELPIGPRTAVRWLAAVGNGQKETAWALFMVLDSSEHAHDDRELFLQTLVRGFCGTWSAGGSCQHRHD